MLNEWEEKYMASQLEKLRLITDRCRETMHEPDEQSLTAKCVGAYFDNAGLPNEKVIVLRRKIAKGEYAVLKINLATLIALARKAKL